VRQKIPHVVVLSQDMFDQWAKASGVDYKHRYGVKCLDNATSVFGKCRRVIVYALSNVKALLHEERARMLACFPFSKKTAVIALSLSGKHVRLKNFDQISLPFGEPFDSIVDDIYTGVNEPEEKIIKRLKCWKEKCRKRKRVALTPSAWFNTNLTAWSDKLGMEKYLKENERLIAQLSAQIHFMLHSFARDTNGDAHFDVRNLNYYYSQYFEESSADLKYFCSRLQIRCTDDLLNLLPGVEYVDQVLTPKYPEDIEFDQFIEEAIRSDELRCLRVEAGADACGRYVRHHNTCGKAVREKYGSDRRVVRKKSGERRMKPY